MDLYEELLGIVDTLAENGIDYALCGGIAVAFYGYARFTKDIDLLIRAEDLEMVREAVRKRGFDLDSGKIPFGAGKPAHREVYRVSKSEKDQILTRDLLLVSPVLEDVWKDRELIEWSSRKVQIVSLEGLAVMKRLAGRDQDWLDLKQLGLADAGEGDGEP